MVGRLEDMLQPGEKVAYRARIGMSRFFKYWLAGTAFFIALHFGLKWLSTSIHLEPLGTAGYTLSPFFVVGMSLLLAFVLLAQGEALVTDRRLLRRRGVIRRRIDELALSEVKRVHGLETGSPRSVQVENAEGVLLTLDELPQARPLGRAVAQAAGLSVPAASAPIAERAAKVLILGGMYGPILGFCLTIWALLGFANLDRSDPMGIVGFALVFTIIVPGAVGVIVGWILGSLLAILYLRPMVTAEEIRTAIYVDLGATSFQNDDFRRLGRRMLLRLASLLYGQRITPPNNGGEELVQ